MGNPSVFNRTLSGENRDCARVVTWQARIAQEEVSGQLVWMCRKVQTLNLVEHLQVKTSLQNFRWRMSQALLQQSGQEKLLHHRPSYSLLKGGEDGHKISVDLDFSASVKIT